MPSGNTLNQKVDGEHADGEPATGHCESRCGSGLSCPARAAWLRVVVHWLVSSTSTCARQAQAGRSAELPTPAKLSEERPDKRSSEAKRPEEDEARQGRAVRKMRRAHLDGGRTLTLDEKNVVLYRHRAGVIEERRR